jgi:SAM-dependent methyltransferase
VSHEWGSAPEFVGPRHELRERLLLGLFLSGEPGRRVLNAGAGAGSFSRRLADRGFEVTSADASPAALAVLADSVPGDVLQADVTSLPFPDGSFDGVVLGEVLEHVEDDTGALAECRRVLAQHGVIALSVPANPDRFGPSDRWAGHIRRYSREALLEAVRGAGLHVERCTAWGFPFSALYHRHIYERHVDRHGAAQPKRWQRPAVAILRGALQIDRLFVGVERGALGYLLLARRS